MPEKIVILGGGESGTGSAILAASKGFQVLVSDAGKLREKYALELQAEGIAYEEGGHTEESILEAALVVKSPGVPENAPLVLKLHEKGIPVVSEIEFAGRYTNAFTICITGSNGKTTTTNLIYHMLKKAGMDVAMAGNVGQSFARQVAREEHKYYVIELSSFQLDGMFDFRANMAILLNITPDHLDRYDYKMQNYIDSKMRIIRNMRAEDVLIYCYDDAVIPEELSKNTSLAQCFPFSLEKCEGMAACVEGNQLNFNIQQNHFSMSIHDLALKGRHNMYNSMAAAISGKVLHIRNEHVRQSLSDFRGVEHRLEPVISVHGIQFINDSKATNVNSTWYALECMETEVVWIVGGVDKGNDYNELMPLVDEKVKAVVCLGKDNAKIMKAFEGRVESVVETSSMQEAVRSAYYLAQKGDTVLLSPACASFDLFDNYEDRGRQFKESVRNL